MASSRMVFSTKTRSAKSSKFDQLPDEMLVEIFKHLGVRSLVECRKVCKK